MTSPRPFAAACAAAFTVLVLGGCGAASGGTPPQATVPGSSAGPAGPTGPATSAPLDPATTSATLAVYYLGNERIWPEVGPLPVDRIKLYREFRRLPVGDGGPRARTEAAVAEMLDRSSASDPDYSTGWPAGARVRQIRIDGDTVTADLGGARRNSVGAEAAHQAVQQLIWTVTAASGRSGVRLLLDGEQVDELWGHVGVEGVLRRGPAAEVIAHVWLIDPQHGATVGRTFTVHVSGIVFESTVYIRVRQGDRTVHQTFVTLVGGTLSRHGEAKASLTLPRGEYTVEAFDSSAANGRDLFLDDHAITVR